MKDVIIHTYIYTFHGSINCVKTIACGTHDNIQNIYRIIQCQIFETFIQSYKSVLVSISGHPFMPETHPQSKRSVHLCIFWCYFKILSFHS
jgi:hypothetical protein